MTPATRKSAAFEIRGAEPLRSRGGGRGQLRLLSSGDGWSLVGSGGELVFQALGTRGRHQCLEFARAHGVLAVYS